MPEFKIVGIERRGSNRSPLTEALMAGNTVLLPLGNRSVGAYAGTLKRRGFKVHQHQAEDGLVVWAEKIDDER